LHQTSGVKSKAAAHYLLQATTQKCLSKIAKPSTFVSSADKRNCYSVSADQFCFSPPQKDALQRSREFLSSLLGSPFSFEEAFPFPGISKDHIASRGFFNFNLIAVLVKAFGDRFVNKICQEFRGNLFSLQTPTLDSKRGEVSLLFV